MNTLRVGIATYGQMKERTMAIARGDMKRSSNAPKVWFSSVESFAKVLSKRNQDLLRVIAERKPSSVDELATLTGRKKSNVSRTLKTMQSYGLVELQHGQKRRLVPKVLHRHVVLDLDLIDGVRQPMHS